MYFVYHEFPELPILSWCAIIQRMKPEAHIIHGSGVETHTEFFVEGAWDGDFLSAAFDHASFLLGSGGRCRQAKGRRQISFATPNHILERLYSLKKEDYLYISNSLPFILQLSGSKLDIEYLGYERDFHTILNGIKGYTKEIKLIHGYGT